MHPRQTKPQAQNHSQQRQKDRLQNFNTFGLCNSANHEREDSRTRATNGSSKSNRANVKMFWKQLGRGHNRGGEQRTKEETLEGDCDNGDVELGD